MQKISPMYRLVPLVFLTLFMVLSLTLSSCNQPIFDPTPTVTATLTATPVCPQDVGISPETVKIYPQLIIVLFEDNPAYRYYAFAGMKILEEALPEVIGPGDYVIMLKMEPLTLGDATFVQSKVESLSPPAIPPSPTPFPTVTGTSVPATPQTRIGELAATQAAAATITSINATATFTTFLHNCAMGDWNSQYLGEEQKWQEEKMEATGRFFREFDEEKDSFDDEEPIARSGVWNGLALATIILENECANYSRCVLIIFSDMNEVTTDQGELYINLKDTEVLVAMLNCRFLFTGQCGHWRDFWLNNTTSVSIDFINSDNATEAIKAFLRR